MEVDSEEEKPEQNPSEDMEVDTEESASEDMEVDTEESASEVEDSEDEERVELHKHQLAKYENPSMERIANKAGREEELTEEEMER